MWNKHIEGQEDLHIPVPDFEECMRFIADDFLGEESTSSEDTKVHKRGNHFDRRFQTIS